MLFVNICISKGSKILHRWYIHPISYEMTIEDFFIKLITKELSPECNIIISSSKVIERIKISETPTAIIIQVSPICNIMKLTTSIEICIQYQLKTDNNIIPNLVTQKNGLIVLMQNAYQNK